MQSLAKWRLFPYSCYNAVYPKEEIILIKLTALFFAISMIIALSLSNCSAYAEKVEFHDKGNALSAHYISPNKGAPPKGVIVFVHGDGALPYNAHSYYEPIWANILEADYAVLSWDKPGIGGSTGNWLSQSMEDRQSEVRAAISFLKKHYGYKQGQIGLLGFSQAGWVVPAVAKNNQDVGFLIGIGFAINWMDQGWYMEKTRMQQENRTKPEIQAAYQEHIKELTFLKTNPSYAEYQEEHQGDPTLMSKNRFNFVKKNFLADAIDDYQGIKQPLLILLGEQDLNVDIEDTQKTLESIFTKQRNATIAVIPNATHGLLKHPKFSEQNPGLGFLLRLMWDGKNAHADGAFQTLDNWLKQLP
jgi:alpha-beta hydrolase superfamily lysophospholipase